MFTTALFIILYLAGVPVSAGVLGEPFGKADKILLVFLAAMSWFGVALFIGVTFAFMAWFRMYAVGRSIERWLEQLTADL